MQVFMKFYRIVTFVVFYLIKLIQANFYIAYDILTPNMNPEPGFVNIPLVLTSDGAILLYSNLVSMTPGTLSTDISDDKKCIEIHVLYLKNKEAKVEAELMALQNRITKLTS